MSFKIVASDHFDKQLKKLSKKYPSIKQDLILLREALIQNPFQGSPLGKNCYKNEYCLQKSRKVRRCSGYYLC